MCVHAVTIQHRGRANRSIDHDTHGHRLGQDKAQAGFEGSQQARALDQEVAITSPPSSVRLVSSLRIDWVGGIEIVLGLLVCVLLKRKKAESEAQRGKPKGTLESESRKMR